MWAAVQVPNICLSHLTYFEVILWRFTGCLMLGGAQLKYFNKETIGMQVYGDIVFTIILEWNIQMSPLLPPGGQSLY